MKITVLFGSPHSKGNTKRLLESFLSGLRADDSVKLFGCYELNAAACCGCGQCERAFVCRFGDLDALMKSLGLSDVIVIATPVYNLSFPAPLKAVVDRMQRCFAAERRGDNPFSGKTKKIVLLLTAGAPSEKGETIKKQLSYLLPSLNASLFGCVVAADCDKGSIKEEALASALDTARRLTAGEQAQ